MFKFKGISSKDMQVIIEEEEHFIARAARRYETIEIEGRDGAIFNELGYAYVERPIYVQCLNPDKIDEILSWLDGEGEFEYKGRKTTARFYSELEPKREGYIKIIDTTFIRDPFWTKLDDEFVEIKGKKEKTQESENINIKGTIPTKFKEFVVGGNSKQETRSGKNMLAVINASVTSNGVTITNNEDGSITLNGTATANVYYNLNANSNSKKYFTLINGNAYGILLKNSVNGLSFIARSETKNYALLSLTSGEERTMAYNYETDEQCFAYIQVNSGTVLNNVTVYPMLVEDSEIGNWEAYGAMPSPEYPSKIQNVEGNVNVTVCNKNIANPEEVWNNMQAYNSSYCSEVVEDGKECIRFRNGNFRPNVATPFNLINYKYKENTSYTIRGMFKKDGDAEGQAVSFAVVYTDGTREYIVSSGNDWQELRIVSNAQKTIQRVGFSFGSYSYWFLDKSSIFIAEGDTTDYVEHQEQVVTFPLAEGQRLMLGDYLAADGIHHKRKQIELDGTENWQKRSNTNNTFQFIISETSQNGICNNYKSIKSSQIDKEDGIYLLYTNAIIITDFRFTTVADFKNHLSTKKEANEPVVIEYELTEEEIEAYTEEQKEAYNQLINLKAYEEETNVYSTNSTSPIFKVTYLEETTEKIVNEGNIYSRPILRLEKTSYNNVDLEIAGTRFQYDFNNEEYVEIDCEEKTALYEGLNRNRKMTIGYEFPKLVPGSNDIKMYEGDCILKAKRKDRWL